MGSLSSACLSWHKMSARDPLLKKTESQDILACHPSIFAAEYNAWPLLPLAHAYRETMMPKQTVYGMVDN